MDIDSQRVSKTHLVAQPVGRPVVKRDSSRDEIADGGDFSSEEGDEAFLDALDTLS